MEGCDGEGDKDSVPADRASIFWLQLQTPCDLPVLSCCARAQTRLCWTPGGTLYDAHQKTTSCFLSKHENRINISWSYYTTVINAVCVSKHAWTSTMKAATQNAAAFKQQ